MSIYLAGVSLMALLGVVLLVGLFVRGWLTNVRDYEWGVVYVALASLTSWAGVVAVLLILVTWVSVQIVFFAETDNRKDGAS